MKQRVATGHLTSIGESTTQLKAMCFRQDSGTLPLREPLQAVLAQLEELRRVNRELRMQALQFGWEWDDASRSLVVSRHRRGTMKDLQAKGKSSTRRSHRASRRAAAAETPLTASDREEEWEGFDDSDGEEWPEETELAPRPGSRGSGACAAAAKFASRGRRKKNRGGGVT